MCPSSLENSTGQKHTEARSLGNEGGLRAGTAAARENRRSAAAPSGAEGYTQSPAWSEGRGTARTVTCTKEKQASRACAVRGRERSCHGGAWTGLEAGSGSAGNLLS